MEEDTRLHSLQEPSEKLIIYLKKIRTIVFF